MKKVFYTLLIIMVGVGLFSPLIYADTHEAPETSYELLAPLIDSNKQDVESVTPTSYLENIYRLVIALAAVVAVVKIILAGIKYMSVDAIKGKSDARKDIEQALLGLVVVAGAWLLLNTINPDLTKINLNLSEVDSSGELGGSLGREYEVDPDLLGCTGCVSLNEAPYSLILKKSCHTAGCYVQEELGEALLGLRDDLGLEGIAWRITESYPPIYGRHTNACHQPNNSRTASCVDASFIGNHTPEKVLTFLIYASARDLNVVYEVETLADQERYRRETGLTDQIKAVRLPACAPDVIPIIKGDGRYDNCCPRELVGIGTDKSCSWITAPHFSIYLR